MSCQRRSNIFNWNPRTSGEENAPSSSYSPQCSGPPILDLKISTFIPNPADPNTHYRDVTLTVPGTNNSITVRFLAKKIYLDFYEFGWTFVDFIPQKGVTSYIPGYGFSIVLGDGITNLEGKYMVNDTYTLSYDPNVYAKGLFNNQTAWIEFERTYRNGTAVSGSGNTTTILVSNQTPNPNRLIPNALALNKIIQINQNVTKQYNVGNKCNICQTLPTDQNDNIEVPSILIYAQTTINGSDIGDAVFHICDEYDYKTCDIIDNTCANSRLINIADIKETQYRKCCPDIFIVSVLRGKGMTAFERVLDIYNKYLSDSGLRLDEFYGGIITFAMVKYFLAKTVYGDFNVKYLLRKYNEDFFRRLKRTRFCVFEQFFTDYQPTLGYDKYFRYDI